MCTIKITCIECGNKFEMTEHEVEFYKKKRFATPKRCKMCRQAHKCDDLDTNKLGLKRNSFGDHIRIFGMPVDVRNEHPHDDLWSQYYKR